MSVKTGTANVPLGQSPGCDPTPKGGPKQRGSGLFSILRWFRSSSSRESVTQESASSSSSSSSSTSSSTSSSLGSIESISSSGTIASFSFVPAKEYKAVQKQRSVPLQIGPETDTYRARLKQRDKRRESDKDLTLRKKYNLFFHPKTEREPEPDNSKSLPLMTKKTVDLEDEKAHRRTNSESSKVKRAGAYCHVKGKRKAPQPPVINRSVSQDDSSTLSLRRKKRLAPQPPSVSAEKVKSSLDRFGTIEYADADVLFNDSLKLDRGILKPAKEVPSSVTTNVVEAPVSPRPWYKRNLSREQKKEQAKFEFIQKIPSDVQFVKPEEPKGKKEDKRKSGIAFLTNISELDREAGEIVRKLGEKEIGPPAFMRPKQENKVDGDSLVSPKRKSARDLIAKFNAITNVTKVTVNSALFGGDGQKRDYFGRNPQKNLPKQTKSMEEPDKIVDKNRNKIPLMKSESAVVMASKEAKRGTPKFERKTWFCPKCTHENEYWRIICCMCNTIKPYFDDLAVPTRNSSSPVKNRTDLEIKRVPVDENTTESTVPNETNLLLERSKTQIGFSALTKYNNQSTKSKQDGQNETKEQERERLKKMLIEMKNSLPKRRLDALEKQKARTSVIEEKNEYQDLPKQVPPKQEPPKQEPQEQAILITKETVYENIKMKKTDRSKPLKISSSAQTSGVLRTPIFIPGLLGSKETKNSFELMRPKDFDNIYSVKTEKSEDHLYANLLQNKDLFLNMPLKFNELKNSTNNTDTLEINRLLKRLETSIAKGELTEAGNLARDLAQLKVNCSVIRQKSYDEAAANSKRKTGFTIDMFVEDKISHRGPFPILVTAMQTVAQLKEQVEEEYQIPKNVQRWILGKELASDDGATLVSLKISPGCPVFLYLVAPTQDSQVVTKNEEIKKIEASAKEPRPGCSKTNTDSSLSAANSKTEKHIETKKTQKIEKPEEKQLEQKLEPKPIGVEKVQPTKVIEKNKEKLIIDKQEEKLEMKVGISLKSEILKSNNVTEKPTSSKAPTENHIDKKMTTLITSVEEHEEFDNKTLKPQNLKNWECHMCTLINPVNLNFCSVCTTKRQTVTPSTSTESTQPKNKDIDNSTSNSKKIKGKAPQAPRKDQHYLQLLNLDNSDLVENREQFECLVCFTEIPSGKGVTLRECLHQFCRPCLALTVEFCEDAEVKCPYRDADYSCEIALQDREVKALVTPQIYDQFLAKSVAQAENKIDKSFHCKTPDCKGWCIFEDNVNDFRCPVCRKLNCLTCQAIHMGVNCKEYQERMREESSTDENAKRTQEMLEEMVQRGEAIKCPTCQVTLMKKWGCDWLRCSMCKTEICWVTRGPRWGPSGRGDTTGGCKCGVNGVKCHPQCNYCH